MKHFRIVHRLPWRLRILAPSRVKNEERCYLVEILLRKHAAIREVRAAPRIGSVTIQYDAAQLPEVRLVALLDAVIGNLVRAAKNSAVPAALAVATPPPTAAPLRCSRLQRRLWWSTPISPCRNASPRSRA